MKIKKIFLLLLFCAFSFFLFVSDVKDVSNDKVFSSEISSMLEKFFFEKNNGNKEASAENIKSELIYANVEPFLKYRLRSILSNEKDAYFLSNEEKHDTVLVESGISRKQSILAKCQAIYSDFYEKEHSHFKLESIDGADFSVRRFDFVKNVLCEDASFHFCFSKDGKKWIYGKNYFFIFSEEDFPEALLISPRGNEGEISERFSKKYFFDGRKCTVGSDSYISEKTSCCRIFDGNDLKNFILSEKYFPGGRYVYFDFLNFKKSDY